MTSILLGQMEMIANFEEVRLKQHYLCAIAAYIVGAGFHSLHEIIGPAQISLDLVPGYNITVTSVTTRAAPANYSAFYNLQARIDLDFRARREYAWQRYVSFFAVKNGLPLEINSEHTLSSTSALTHLSPKTNSRVCRVISLGLATLTVVGLFACRKLMANTESILEQSLAI